MRTPLRICAALALLALAIPARAESTLASPTYARIKAALDAVRAIDTHDHLYPFDDLPGYLDTPAGRGMTLAGLWRNSYLGGIVRFPAWPASGSFVQWWSTGKDVFPPVRTTSVYRYTKIALQDLYGVDFDTITDEQARALNDRIFASYRDPRWLQEVITKRANIELMFNDPHWAPLDFKTSYDFGVLVFRVNGLIHGVHPAALKLKDSPFVFAQREGLKINTLDDYLALVDLMFRRAKEAGAVCLKTTVAYERTLQFDEVPQERAARIFGHPPAELSPADVKAFEDFMMWHLCRLSAQYELPFQIHTGHGRLQGSNPMLLIDLMAANPKTKFILFHGGYPWIGESGAITLRALAGPANVWLDSVWLPTLSSSAAKRAFHEWLDLLPADRVMWGGDCNHAEGIYGATELTRRCLAEVLAERIDRGELREEDALRIGRGILRENALTLFPQLRQRVAKGE